MSAQSQYKMQLLEKKKLEYERLREQKRRFEAEMQKLDQQQLREEYDIAQMQEDLGRGNTLTITGHQSEPTTPPEYRETSFGFPTAFSRPNRYSMSSLASPPGLFNRSSRPGSQLTSPPSGLSQSQSQARFSYGDYLPSHSMPTTRRNSDDEAKEEAFRQDPSSRRSGNALNRYSMPVTRRGNLYDNIDQTNAAGFLFRDDEAGADPHRYSAIDTSADDGYPGAYQKKNNSNKMPSSTAAMDLATQRAGGESTSSGWGTMSRHRQQQSLSGSNSAQASTAEARVPGQTTSSDMSSLAPRPGRHPVDMSQYRDTSNDNAAATPLSPTSKQVMATPPRLQSSHSSSEIATIKSTNAILNPNAHALQHLHNHNASIGRIPPGAVKRHSRELSSEGHVAVTQPGGYPSIQSQLHANAPSFGPSMTSQAPAQAATGSTPPVSGAGSPGQYPPYYAGPGYVPGMSGNGYGMSFLPMAMQNMNLNSGYHPGYPGYAPGYPTAQQQQQQQPPQQPRDSQQRVIQARRAQDNEAAIKYQNKPFEECIGEIYEMAKDQHGCRYLQKQLEARNPEQIHLIWKETNPHIVELMTDPFGNYLCQKLLEFCDDNERTVLIQNASHSMVDIALNQHGTRALQKMIEFVSSPVQVDLIIQALQRDVVSMIKDLNGNHVIQKCLNKLTSADAEFIFSAVGGNCIEVGTHRHGCCVLQRCIDHASGPQKTWLVARITDAALQLVQDPFGNYVVQYIIDLNEPSFTEPIVQNFLGQIGDLSRHKFSSNVIEKCLRCATEPSTDAMVRELLNSGEMDKLLRDSFGNYVVQTALEHSSYSMKPQLADVIRPLLPSIRSTPYGRRLQAKIQAYDSHSRSTSSSGQVTPADSTQGQIPLRTPAHNRGMPNSSNGHGNGYSGGMHSGRGQNHYNTNVNMPPQSSRANSYQSYGGNSNTPSGPAQNGTEGQFF
ncbi:armadillo-type protein [Microdochium bolleyi]|uniref:Armadillo-type protein n=1 Tax=Microdochium bolleyi TaxID=196109 RepID=A0A136JIA8_9PEZI|nr:armadillo-type protein [Microdochium bolleyi]